MCQEYEYQQMQCGQCHAWHGALRHEDLRRTCQTAKANGGFGRCPRRTQSVEIRRIGWRDCENCAQRGKVHAMWTGGSATGPAVPRAVV